MSRTEGPALPVPVRVQLAVVAGRAAGHASRLLHGGAGATVVGRVTGALAPDALPALARGRDVVLVTGTNGKTTTTALVAAALGGACTNATGANLPAGVLTALEDDPRPLAVLEVDEAHLPSVAARTHPRLVLLLNLSRDQLHRNPEVGRLARRFREVLPDSGATVVANAADPHTAYAAEGSPTRWVLPGAVWSRDAAACPACGALLERGPRGWACRCGRGQPAAYALVRPSGAVVVDGEEVPLQLPLPGLVNRDNACFALVAAAELGVAPLVAAPRLRAVGDVAGRYAVRRVGGRAVSMLLAKNPAGMAQALTMLPLHGSLALGVNDEGVDGRDTSWLWDVDFRGLRGRPVGVFGSARADLALRLSYDGVAARSAASLPALLAQLPADPVTMLANYSAFRAVAVAR